VATLKLPEILTAQHISTYLGISRKKIYQLFQVKPTAGGIPNFAIGSFKRVDKQDFLRWIEARKGEQGETLDLTSTDIVTNRVGHRRRTSLREVVEIAEICFRVLQRGERCSLNRPLTIRRDCHENLKARDQQFRGNIGI